MRRLLSVSGVPASPLVPHDTLIVRFVCVVPISTPQLLESQRAMGVELPVGELSLPPSLRYGETEPLTGTTPPMASSVYFFLSWLFVGLGYY